MDFTRSRVLVTGGAGFIGSALVWELNRRGCERIVVSDLRKASDPRPNLAPLKMESYFEATELLEKLRGNALGRFDLVLHMGANSSTLEANEDLLRRNNFEYTRDLASWALGHGARFVYASSAATYGDGSAGMSDKESDLSKFQPLNLYGKSKHLFDMHAQKAGILDRIVGLKYFNVFGPNEGHKGMMRSVVNKAYGEVLETGRIHLFKSYRPEYKDGEQKRDFLYVKDAVFMTLFLAANVKASGLFNIGSGKAHTWLDLAQAVFAALGKPPRIEFIDMPQELRAKYQYFTQADLSKLREAGYHEPVTPLQDAVSDYVKNYLVPGKPLSLVS